MAYIRRHQEGETKKQLISCPTEKTGNTPTQVADKQADKQSQTTVQWII